MISETKIAFISLGCDKNLVDSEIMLGIIDEYGYKIVPNEEDADIVIVNSCGFIMNANEEAIENVLRIADYKKSGKLKAIIVTGCMAQRYENEIFKSLPEVDAVVGTGDFERIGEVIKRLIDGERQIKIVEDKNKRPDENNSYKRIITTAGGFGYLKIAEGCDNFCTYCTIPSLRGKYRSRNFESLVKEAEIMAEKGVREIILVAQDTSLYGTDLYGRNRLHELICSISEIEDIQWIRLMYCYPEHITEQTIEEMAKNPKLCHYIDMPVQHGDDKILKAMGRKTDRKSLELIIKTLREKIPDICIRTTLITGFPGEGEAEFNSLVDFVEKMKFDRLGVFAYSREEGTPAYNMPNQVDEDIKLKRRDFIMQLQKNISAQKGLDFVGKVLKVIIEGKIEGEDNIYCSRSYRDCYEIDGFVFFESEKELIAGDFYNVKITQSSDYDLIGEICDEFAE